MSETKSIFKGYPYGEPISYKIFPLENRPVGQQIDKAAKDGIGLPAEIVAQYSKALHEAEEQVKDLQREYPFLPEDYGFIQLNEFELKYKAIAGNVGLDRVNDVTWRIRSFNREFENIDGKVVEELDNLDILVTIRNEKDAYAAFKLLGLLKYIKTQQHEEPTTEPVAIANIVLTDPTPVPIEKEEEKETTTNTNPETTSPEISPENTELQNKNETPGDDQKDVSGFPNRAEDQQSKVIKGKVPDGAEGEEKKD